MGLRLPQVIGEIHGGLLIIGVHGLEFKIIVMCIIVNRMVHPLCRNKVVNKMPIKVISFLCIITGIPPFIIINALP